MQGGTFTFVAADCGAGGEPEMDHATEDSGSEETMVMHRLSSGAVHEILDRHGLALHRGPEFPMPMDRESGNAFQAKCHVVGRTQRAG